MGKWFNVILSAVVLGLAVSYIINMWMPEDAFDWVLVVAAGVIALRSGLRIAQLAKANAKSDNSTEEQE
jgi:hypothetical protein